MSRLEKVVDISRLEKVVDISRVEKVVDTSSQVQEQEERKSEIKKVIISKAIPIIDQKTRTPLKSNIKVVPPVNVSPKSPRNYS